MASELTGREVIIGLKKAETWHTPVACGAGDGILINSDNIKVSTPSELDDSAGQEWITQADAGVKDVKGSIEAYMRYEGFDVALALIMGAAGAPVQQATTTAYLHTLSLASSIFGKFATMAQLKLSTKVWELTSLKLHGFKLSADMNKPVKLSLNGIADTLDRGSAVNTTTTIANVTYPDTVHRIIMNKDTVVRINNQADGALGSGDAVYPTSIEFSFNRPMDAEPVAGQDGVDEPTDNGFPVCTCTMKFPRYNAANDAFFTDWDSFTSKKMDISFIGPLIEAPYYYKFMLSMPHVKINNPAAPVSGPGKIPFSLSFDLLAAVTAPTGMTHTEPFNLAVINKRSTNPLA